MRNNVRVFFAIAMLALAALACQAMGGGGDTGSDVILSDDFSSELWGTGTDIDSAVEYVNGTLNFLVFTENFFVWSTPDAEDYENVHIEVTAINDSTDSTGAFGVICDLQDVTDTSYYFAVTGAGEYAIGRYSLTGDDLLTNDGSWGTSDAITSGADSYRIGADCGNGTFTLYVDGTQVDSVNDTFYTSGGVGLFAWSGEEIDGTNVSFDDFVMTKLP